MLAQEDSSGKLNIKIFQNSGMIIWSSSTKVHLVLKVRRNFSSIFTDLFMLQQFTCKLCKLLHVKSKMQISLSQLSPTDSHPYINEFFPNFNLIPMSIFFERIPYQYSNQICTIMSFKKNFLRFIWKTSKMLHYCITVICALT